VTSPRQAGLRRAYGEVRNVLYVLGAIIFVWAVVLAAIWMFTGSDDEAPPAGVPNTQLGSSTPTYVQQQP
jgi:hypothetical protein